MLACVQESKTKKLAKIGDKMTELIFFIYLFDLYYAYHQNITHTHLVCWFDSHDIDVFHLRFLWKDFKLLVG